MCICISLSVTTFCTTVSTFHSSPLSLLYSLTLLFFLYVHRCHNTDAHVISLKQKATTQLHGRFFFIFFLFVKNVLRLCTLLYRSAHYFSLLLCCTVELKSLVRNKMTVLQIRTDEILSFSLISGCLCSLWLASSNLHSYIHFYCDILEHLCSCWLILPIFFVCLFSITVVHTFRLASLMLVFLLSAFYLLAVTLLLFMFMQC